MAQKSSRELTPLPKPHRWWGLVAPSPRTHCRSRWQPPPGPPLNVNPGPIYKTCHHQFWLRSCAYNATQIRKTVYQLRNISLNNTNLLVRLRVFECDKPDCLRRGAEQFVNDPTQSRPLQTMCHRLSVKLHDTTSESPLRVSHASAGGATSGHPVTDKRNPVRILWHKTHKKLQQS